jgi:hypothetical protein
MTATLVDLSSDLRDWKRAGFDRDFLTWLLPLAPTCEFSSVPLHGCECNGCLEWCLDGLAS